jgi:hypothetical protein
VRVRNMAAPLLFQGCTELVKSTVNLADAINSLMPDEQESVRQFVEFLKRKGQAPSTPG